VCVKLHVCVYGATCVCVCASVVIYAIVCAKQSRES
jgi:hypothetical protein